MFSDSYTNPSILLAYYASTLALNKSYFYDNTQWPKGGNLRRLNSLHFKMQRKRSSMVKLK